MSLFTDKDGNEWDMSLTVGSVMDLAKFYRMDDADKVISDKITDVLFRGSYVDLFTLFWGVLKKQAEARGVTQEQFSRMDPVDLEKAGEALQDAIVNFTRPSQRQILLKTIEKAKSLETEAMTAALRKMDDPETERRIVAQMETLMDREMENIDLQSQTSLKAL